MCAIIELVPEPVVQHAKGEDTMPTPEERLNSLENNFDQFQTEAVQAYKTMFHETTLLKGLVLDNNTRVTALSDRVVKIDRRLEHIDLRLDGMDAHLDYMDKRINGIDKRLNGMDEHLERIDLRFDSIDAHLNQLEATQHDQALFLAEQTTRLNRIETIQAEQTTRLDRIEIVLDKILERLPA